MVIEVLRSRTVGEVQQDFSQQYPFLKIDFYKDGYQKPAAPGVRQKLAIGTRLLTLMNFREGALDICDEMTVGQLESTFRDRFGLNAQVSRKSGPVWLETTVTDKWTLKQQNEHGRELSIATGSKLPESEIDFES
jgi:hypothetical protein